MKLYEINNKKEYDFSCIYLWTNLVNGKKYVGQTSCFASRMSHYRSGRFNDRMKKDIDLYGVDSFEIDILEKDVPHCMLDEREQYWIDYYQSYKEDVGYNICQFAGSTRGYKHTPEQCLAKSERMRGENNVMYGKKHTEEWRKEHSEWLKNKWATDEEYRKFWKERMSGEKNYFYGKHFSGELNPMYGKHHSQTTKDKLSKAIGKSVRCVETGDVYTSITRAAQAIGVTRCVVSEALHKGYRAGGYHWEFV